MTDLPLYPSEAQIARKVLGPHRLDEWRRLTVLALPAISRLEDAVARPSTEALEQEMSHTYPVNTHTSAKGSV